MRFELIYPSRYISAADLIEKGGKDYTLTIKRLFLDELQCKGNQTERKAVIEFERAKKMLVVNVTNLRTIADLYGPETNDWHGKRITLYPTRVQAFGKTVDAIRIRAEMPPDKGRGGTRKAAPEQSGDGAPPGYERDPNTGELLPMAGATG